MAGFHDIIGHDMVKDHLQKAIEYHKVSHAYILSGEEGMGRKTIARAFAMTLLCEKVIRNHVCSATPANRLCRATIRMLSG